MEHSQVRSVNRKNQPERQMDVEVTRNETVSVTEIIVAFRVLSLLRIYLESEFVAEHDERLKYISGFSGSYGVAVITETKAALWTDGRYLLQADNELGCDWLLMGRGDVQLDDVESGVSSVRSGAGEFTN
ncbi:Xaa-Pro aminopeptidase 2 [Homalodisca vitripennis]|nr:Xaa-Pro aminopeptidase 2 [Homalodisca vitripennis]